MSELSTGSKSPCLRKVIKPKFKERQTTMLDFIILNTSVAIFSEVPYVVMNGTRVLLIIL